MSVSTPLSVRFPGLPCSKGSLCFIKNLDKYKQEKPYKWSGDLDPAHAHLRSNIVLERIHDIPVRDVRSLMGTKEMSLGGNGFDIVLHDEVDDKALRDVSKVQAYVEGLAKKLETMLSAELVVCFNFVFRRCDQEEMDQPESILSDNGLGSFTVPEGAGWPAHVDYTQDFAPTVIRDYLSPPEASKYLDNQDRYRTWLVNAWKPLHHSVENAPLVFCDPSTVSAADFIEVDLPSDKRPAGETTYLKYNPLQEWHWCSRQSPNEVSLFKCWDTESPDTGVSVVPHVAMKLDDSPVARSVVRESIEARMIVVIDKSTA